MIVSLDEICYLVGLQLGVRNVRGPNLILENLGAESIDVVNITATVEEKYQIEIDEADMADLRTVADLHRLVQRLLANKGS